MTVPSATQSARPSPAPAGSQHLTPAERRVEANETTRRRLRGHWAPPLVVAGIGLFLSVLDQTVTGVAYQAIQKELGGNNVDIQWVTTSYRLGQGIVVPLALWAARRFGLRPMYILSMVLYIVTSALCAAAQSLPALVVFRFLQGLPGGLAAIVSISIVSVVLPPAKQAAGQGLMMSFVLSAPGFSPALGGFFVEHLDWRMNFFITVPIALLGLIAIFIVLPPLPSGTPTPFDWGGFLCLSTALATLLLATSKGSDWGWTSYVILILFAVSLDAFILYVIIERHVEQPLLNLRLFASQPFVIGCVLVSVVITGLSSIPSYLPQYLQQVQSMTPTGSGVVLLPQAASLVVGVPIAGLLLRALGPRWLIALGLAILGTGSLYLDRLMNVDVPRPMLIMILCVRAFGLGLCLVPVLGATVAVLPPALIADGIAFRTMFQRIGPEVALLYFTAHSSHRQKQILNDRTQLLSPDEAPRLHAAQRMDQTTLLPQFQRQQAYDLGQSYGEVFQIIGVIVLAAIVLALVARWGEKLPTEQDVMQNGA